MGFQSSGNYSVIQRIPPSFPSSEKEEEVISDNLEQPVPANTLAPELWNQIFNFATNGGTSRETFSNIRAACKTWHAISDLHTIEPRWQKFQEKITLQSFQVLVNTVNRNIFIKYFVVSLISLAMAPASNEAEGSDVELSFQSGYFSRFYELSCELEKQGAPISNNTILGFECAPYEQLQKTLDFSLETIWTFVQKQINFEGHPIPDDAQAIRAWLSDPANAEKIAHVTELNLSGMHLTALPPEIGCFTQLKRLELFNNRLTNLPESIGTLSQLEYLDLKLNRLQKLPATIGDLSQLTELYLDDNRLTSLPSSIGDLYMLKELDLSENLLQSLPAEIGNLSRLEGLYVSDNQITNWPETLRDLSSLKRFSRDYL